MFIEWEVWLKRFDRDYPKNANLICFGLGLYPGNDNGYWEVLKIPPFCCESVSVAMEIPCTRTEVSHELQAFALILPLFLSFQHETCALRLSYSYFIVELLQSYWNLKGVNRNLPRMNLSQKDELRASSRCFPGFQIFEITPCCKVSPSECPYPFRTCDNKTLSKSFQRV